MRILQVNTADAGGGAEAIARRLHDGYREHGHETWLAVGCRRTNAAGVVEIPNDARRPPWERFFLRRATARRRRLPRYALAAIGSPRRALRHLRGEEDFDFPATRELLALVPAPDVVHAHNLHGGYFDLRELPALSRHVPTLLTLHDAWLTTGHCAHSFDCERWQSGCGQCPYLDTYPAVQRDATAANWQRKRAIYARSRLHVAAPSEWLLSRAKNSILAPAIASAQVIPNGVDLEAFRPASRAEARARLGIANDATVIAAAAAEGNPFKDIATLRDALARIIGARRNVVVVAIGGARFDGVEVRPVIDAMEIADAYRAGDVYLHSARADTFPTAVLEALACGTPVVATRIGGIPE
ncbi:MAG TPA: glycosyltransferase, partial [Thermoanaerobaculia bacterium]|nr:glycosyltransferase [Thermoanaerobaculia bacterium]